MSITMLIVLSWLITQLMVSPDALSVEDLVGDEEITRSIEMALWIDNFTPYEQIEVKSIDQGLVMLSGSVDNILARERAVDIALSIKGVRTVIDKMDVEDSGKEDWEIRLDIQEALMLDPAADSREIAVHVSNGIATLTGVVQSQAEREICTQTAKSVQGVKGVDNQIEVVAQTDRPDHEIKAEIEQRLQFDPLIYFGSTIHVEVGKGNVQLTGEVGSAREKARAEENARVAGVKSVDSDKLEIGNWAINEMRRKEMHPDLPDVDVEESIEDNLLYDPRVWASQVDVQVEDGVAILTGTVDYPSEKKAAEEAARNTVGIREVENDLSVRNNTSILRAGIGHYILTLQRIRRWKVVQNG